MAKGHSNKSLSPYSESDSVHKGTDSVHKNEIPNNERDELVKISELLDKIGVCPQRDGIHSLETLQTH